jgi:hypothetical protein
MMDSCINIGDAGVKDQEKHEMILFKVHMLIKAEKFQEALDHLLANKK